MPINKAYWTPRCLIDSTYHIGLCINKDQFNNELKRLKIPPDQFLSGSNSDATSHFYKSDTGVMLAIVCIDERELKDITNTYGLLVHEAVHIWQEVCIDIGEKYPGDEMEAYSIQRISMYLWDAYKALKKRKNSGGHK